MEAANTVTDQPTTTIAGVPVFVATHHERAISTIRHLPGEGDDTPYAKIILHVREGHEDKDTEDMLSYAKTEVARATYHRDPADFPRLAKAIDDLEDLLGEARALGEAGDHNTAEESLGVWRSIICELAGRTVLAQK